MYSRHFADVSRGGLGWVLIRGGDEDTDTHRGRDPGMMPWVASANGGTPKIPAIPVDKRRAWNGVSLEAPESTVPSAP